MQELSNVVGAVIEAPRYTNVHPRVDEDFVSPERRELWLRTPTGAERRFVIHSRELPARTSHLVLMVLQGDAVVGLFNLSMMQGINYLRTEPWRWLDGSDIVMLLAAMGVSTVLWLGNGLVFGGLAAFVVLAVRRVWLRVLLMRRVDRVLGSVDELFGAQ